MNKNNLKISSINVNGICETVKRSKVMKLLIDSQSDIILVQETHCASLDDWEGASYCSFLTNYSAGTAILIRKDFLGTVTPIHISDDGRIVAADIDHLGSHLRVLSFYAPNIPKDRKFFLSKLTDHLSVTRHNIVGGDFNCVDSIELDTLCHSDTSSSLEGSIELKNSMSDFGLIDSFRYLNPRTKHFTWFGHQATQASRLDRVFVPPKLIENVFAEFFPYSDHKFVHCFLAIETNASNHGKSYWKLNNSILSDKYFREKVEEVLRDSRTLRPAFSSTGEWWDDVKNRIKKVAIKHSSVKKKHNDKLKSDIKSRLEKATTSLEMHALKTQLREITDKELNSLAVRARVDKALYDEKCTSCFFSRVRRRHTKNYIHEIYDDNKNLQTDVHDILKVFHKFYKDLYSKFSGNTSIQSRILDSLNEEHVLAPHASDDSNLKLFDKELMQSCLGNMANNKTPGPDGLTAEFYKTFFDILSDILLELYEEVSEGIIPRSMTEAVTVLIPKEGDAHSPSNYRPITLLNVDYKLMTKTINKSFFTKFLNDNLSNEQLCAVPGRDIRNGTILIRDIISYCKSKGISASIVSLDQKKAFDMVDRCFLYKILKALKVNSRVLRFVDTIYCNTHTSIQVNGHLSSKIPLQRGVRQGCPLSATLYVIYVHAFISYISKSTDFSGISLPGGKQCKVSAYADDLVLFCKDKYDEDYIFSFFDEVSLATGSTLNKAKTNILHIGPKPFSSVYQRTDIKICGIRFDFQNNGVLSFQECEAKIDKRIQKYKHLPLTLHGKVLICNTMLFPLLFYAAATYLPAKSFCENINKRVFSFIWGEGKSEPISRKVIHTPRENGGLGLYDVLVKTKAIYFQSNFMTPCVDGFSHQRKSLFKYFFGF